MGDWNGEGLPPVGTVCEIADSTGTLSIEYPSGTKVKIYSCFVDDRGVALAAFVDQIGDVGGVATARCFRPIRTAEEVAVEAMENICTEMLCPPTDVYQCIYNAIRDGKIPGVKLEDWE